MRCWTTSTWTPTPSSAEVERHAPGILATLHRDGEVEAFVRRRLEPFYTSPEALAILAEAD